MAEEPENRTLRLLLERREERREAYEDLRGRIDGNTLILNMIAGVDAGCESRARALEDRGKS